MVLQRLVDNGDTVLVIEHNLDVIKTSDYIVDLGPEGGERGGTIIATGTPEEIAEVQDSYTGKYLKPVLERDRLRMDRQVEEIEKAHSAANTKVLPGQAALFIKAARLLRVFMLT